MRRLFAAYAALLVQTALAGACSCPRPTLEELIEDRRDLAVFSARVVSILTPEGGKPAVLRLAVTEVIKGEAPRIVEMTGVTAEDEACGVDFRPGEVWTIAAYKKDGRWHTDMCHVPRL